MIELEEIIDNMYQEVLASNEHHFSVRKEFPRELFTQVCQLIAEYERINFNNNIHCDIHLHRVTFSVTFTHWNNTDISLSGFERKVRDEFSALI